MTDKQIIQKIIEKALAGGYNALHVKEFGVGNFASLMMGDGYALAGWLHSHEFAKAFWGEPERIELSGVYETGWQYHLQQMVLEENPIKYLEKFI